jgi:hypothetical protein
LARSRGAAFYAEQSFTQEEAQEAAEDARKVMDMARGLAPFLEGSKP